MMFTKKALFFTLAVVALSTFVPANADSFTSVIGFDDVDRFLMDDGNHTSDDGNYTSYDEEEEEEHDHSSHDGDEHGHEHEHEHEHSSDDSGAANFGLVGSAIVSAFVAAVL